MAKVGGETALGARSDLVAQTNIGEGAADHHFVIAASRTVGVEGALIDAALEQVLASRRLRPESTCRRDVVGRHGVPNFDQAACAADVLGLGRLFGHTVEIWGASDVGGRIGPVKEGAFGSRQRAPML